jgi:hypothetical protein
MHSPHIFATLKMSKCFDKFNNIASLYFYRSSRNTHVCAAL